jgi:hypothetical protein
VWWLKDARFHGAGLSTLVGSSASVTTRMPPGPRGTGRSSPVNTRLVETFDHQPGLHAHAKEGTLAPRPGMDPTLAISHMSTVPSTVRSRHGEPASG